MIKIDPLTTSPNEAEAINALNGIYDYVRAQRVNSRKYPAILPLIADFEGWYGQLENLHDASWQVVGSHVIGKTEVGEANRRKAAVNEAMGQKLPDDWTPADAGQTPPKPPEGSGWGVYLVGAIVVAGITYFLTRA